MLFARNGQDSDFLDFFLPFLFGKKFHNSSIGIMFGIQSNANDCSFALNRYCGVVRVGHQFGTSIWLFNWLLLPTAALAGSIHIQMFIDWWSPFVWCLKSSIAINAIILWTFLGLVGQHWCGHRWWSSKPLCGGGDSALFLRLARIEPERAKSESEWHSVEIQPNRSRSTADFDQPKKLSRDKIEPSRNPNRRNETIANFGDRFANCISNTIPVDEFWCQSIEFGRHFASKTPRFPRCDDEFPESSCAPPERIECQQFAIKMKSRNRKLLS